uniref:Ribosome recycling factor domain-containing protein n=1 Tax=Panagrolaimus sp. JU765 TaxID=591449 RepID=A0AC34R1M8_9BILA
MSIFSRRIFTFPIRFCTKKNPVVGITGSQNVHSGIQSRNLAFSAVALKVRKTDKQKQTNPDLNIVHAAHAHNPIVDVALQEMEKLEAVLEEELSRHFSGKVDLRVYEEIPVILENGEEHRMNRIGRVSLKSPQMVMINFADNPSAIKAAKAALQKSSLAVNPQQEGIVLYIPVPRMTRERREELANAAKTKILHDYKEALNKVYVKFDRKSTKESKSVDEASKTRNLLLATKRSLEKRGVEKITAQQEAMMKEIA